VIAVETSGGGFGAGDDRWITEIVRGPQATLLLASIGLTAAMSDLYEGIDLPDPAAAGPGSDRA
jgi:hypothetical protein